MITDILFFLVAMLAGAINSVAGGGSFLLFPTLMFGGMSSISANIMCTVAMWPGSVASGITYFRAIKTPIAQLRSLIIVSLLGSMLGASLLLATPEVLFKSCVPWLMLGATLIFISGKKLLRFLPHHISMFWALALMFLIAIYGGYFGAGIGILMLALLQLLGHSHIHEMNALKTLLGSAINLVAVVMFILSGQVVWQAAPVLIAGGITGGYVGTKLALRVAPEKIRWLVGAIACLMTAYFFIAA